LAHHLLNKTMGAKIVMANPLSPNILFILTDQQRWDTTGIHGNPLDLTPNFDRIALEGTHLFNTFTCQPVCTPARACLQTGLYSTCSGVYRNGLPLPPDSQTIAKLLIQSGYRTAYIGKWHLGTGEMISPVPEEYRGGYEYWLASNVLEFTSDAYQVTLFDNNENPISLPGYRVDALADAAVRYIDANKTRPFFLFLSFLEPHFQNQHDDYPAPDGYAEKYIGKWIPPDLATLGGSTHQHIAGYYGMVRKLDEALGRLLDTLKSFHYLYLYDLQSDPYELNNLIQLISHQEVADSLRKRLIQRMVLAGETAPIIEPSLDIISNPMRFVYPEEIDN
jgi:arylsulfatase A-like enzyme